MEKVRASTETGTRINPHGRKMGLRMAMDIISVVIAERHTKVSVVSLLMAQRLIKILLQGRIGHKEMAVGQMQQLETISSK